MELLRDLGPALSPFNAHAFITGLETLHLRVRRHSENALKVARWLQDDPRVAWVRYPGLEEDPSYPLARRYLEGGFGGLVAFGVKGGFERGKALIDRVKLFSLLANIGDARSLIIHPASTTHQQLSPRGAADHRHHRGPGAALGRPRASRTTSWPTWTRRSARAERTPWTAARSSAAASPRLFDLRLPPLALRDGGRWSPHHARFQWWGPEADLPVLERLATPSTADAGRARRPQTALPRARTGARARPRRPHGAGGARPHRRRARRPARTAGGDR